jgi:hypothetical protein
MVLPVKPGVGGLVGGCADDLRNWAQSSVWAGQAGGYVGARPTAAS